MPRPNATDAAATTAAVSAWPGTPRRPRGGRARLSVSVYRSVFADRRDLQVHRRADNRVVGDELSVHSPLMSN